MFNSLIRAIFQNSNNSLNKWIKTLPHLISRSNNYSPFPASCFQRTPVLRSKFNMPFQVELELVFHHWKIRDTNFVKNSIALTFTRFSSLEKRNGQLCGSNAHARPAEQINSQYIRNVMHGNAIVKNASHFHEIHNICNFTAHTQNVMHGNANCLECITFPCNSKHPVILQF